MYTETDLRDMLRASADRVRADESMRALSPPSEEPIVLRIRPQRGRTRRRVIAPIAVAASTAAVIAGVVALTQRSNTGHSGPVADPTQTTSRAADPTASTAPHVAPRVGTAPRPRARLTVPVVDEVRIDTRNSTENYVGKVEGGHGQQVVTSQIGHGRSANLVIAPAAAFSDRKIPRTHPLAIAGTTGYYAILRLFPLSADGDGGSAPTGTIVFRTPDRHWAFAWLQKGTKDGNQQGSPVNDPSAIVHGFDSLHATFAAGTTRTPMRLGYLPAGATFHDADLAAAHSRLNVASLTTLSGTKQLDIDIIARSFLVGSAGSGDDDKTCIKAIGCTVRRHRDLPGGFLLQVNGTNYSAAETQKVLDHITVATDPNDPSTYFLLSEAIG